MPPEGTSATVDVEACDEKACSGMAVRGRGEATTCGARDCDSPAVCTGLAGAGPSEPTSATNTCDPLCEDEPDNVPLPPPGAAVMEGVPSPCCFCCCDCVVGSATAPAEVLACALV